MPAAALIVLLLAASLHVWGMAYRRWAGGQPILEFAPRLPSPYLRWAGGAAAIYIALLVLSELVFAASAVDVQASCINGAFVIVVAFALLTGFGRVSLSECGFRFRNLGRRAGEGLQAFLASFAPVLLIMLATNVWRTEKTLHPFLRLIREDPSFSTSAWIVLAAVIIAPIQEELLFRVMLQDGLARRIGAQRAIAIVAVLFCAVHGFPDSLALFPLALILGFVYDRRQSAVTVIFTHALFNLTNLLILLFSNDAPS